MRHPRILIDRPFPEFPSGVWDTSKATVEKVAAAFRAFRENVPFERMVAPVEPVAREYLRKAGLPFDPTKTYILKDPQKPDWGWQGPLEYLMKYWYGEDSTEFCAANLLRLIHQLRNLLARQGPPENVMILTSQLMIALQYAQNTRLFTRPGRPPDLEEAAFRQIYWDAYQKVLSEKIHDGGRLPSKGEVAAEMLISTKTLKRRRDDYTLPWPPLQPH